MGNKIHRFLEHKNKKEIKCLVCKSSKIYRLCKNFSGYIWGTKFEIFQCTECNTQFINPHSLNKKIYEIIYSNKSSPGYDRYFQYAQNIMKQKFPLKWLSQQEEAYLSVWNFLKDKEGLDILEVGCGYGYLTYSLNKFGFRAEGIDISDEAIKFAQKNLGKYFMRSSIEQYHPHKKFDLVIATELIEHLDNPRKFINSCLKLLKPNGRIFLTTPLKPSINRKLLWKTDLPPVHVTWLSHESFKILSKELNLKCVLNDLIDPSILKNNLLVRMIYRKFDYTALPKSNLDNAGNSIKNPRSLIRTCFIKIADFSPIRRISNCIYFYYFTPEIGSFLNVILYQKSV